MVRCPVPDDIRAPVRRFGWGFPAGGLAVAEGGAMLAADADGAGGRAMGQAMAGLQDGMGGKPEEGRMTGGKEDRTALRAGTDAGMDHVGVGRAGVDEAARQATDMAGAGGSGATRATEGVVGGVGGVAGVGAGAGVAGGDGSAAAGVGVGVASSPSPSPSSPPAAASASAGSADLPRYRANLQGEVDGAAVYAALAQGEADPALAGVFDRLAAVERRHGDFWRRRIAALGRRYEPRPSPRARVLAWLARRFGPALVLPTVAANEARDSACYDDQPEARAAGLHQDERSHAVLMQAAAGRGGLPGPTLALLEGRHRGGGNALRAAVLGANDGLVSNASLVMGVAGAAGGDRALMLTGVAGLIAGACSMAMGEWVSVTSSREFYRSQIATEAEELRTVPDEEREELILIYQAKGLPEAQARALAEQLLGNEATALDTLAREELGVDPDAMGGSPWSAAGTSFLLFALGAAVPVAPFFVLGGPAAVAASVAAFAAGLALVGAGTSLFTGRSMSFSALRQLGIGLAAAGVTYGAGALTGAALG